jgi:hypothetical protein
MTLHEFAKILCEIEGKKKQINIAQMKEVLKILINLDAETYHKMVCLFSKQRTKNQIKEMKELVE